MKPIRAYLAEFVDNMGNLGNHETAFEKFQSWAKKSDSNAQCNLGNILSNGYGGVKQDYEQAFLWFEKSAKQGHAMAQVGLAGCITLAEKQALEKTSKKLGTGTSRLPNKGTLQLKI